jgi:FixJ family two-component response regulator
MGMEFQSFASGDEFLRAVSADTRGCLIVDIRMPGLTGHDVHRMLRAGKSRLQVIVLSAQDDPDMRDQARAWGAVSFFRKPVDDQALLDAINWAQGCSGEPGNKE